MNLNAIIVAGGSGTRMKSAIPKQFIELKGRPILMHTIEKFYRAKSAINLVVVLPKNHHHTWKVLCEKYHFNIQHHLCEGGNTRFQSVKNGLSYCDNKGLIAVHDGVRPLISSNLILDLYKQAEQKNAVIPVCPVVESIRKVDGGMSTALDRSMYFAVQTPQCFQASLLKEAYLQEDKNTFTDDASVVETLGAKISLTQGEENNIKITTQKDLYLAEALLER